MRNWPEEVVADAGGEGDAGGFGASVYGRSDMVSGVGNWEGGLFKRGGSQRRYGVERRKEGKKEYRNGGRNEGSRASELKAGM